MDAAFLNTVLIYMRALNEAEKTMGTEGPLPYLGRCEVIMENELVGYLVDHDGGLWQFEVCAEAEKLAFDRRRQTND